jgi:cyclophilin family peptidyl-prolyl cis-trans isomerase
VSPSRHDRQQQLSQRVAQAQAEARRADRHRRLTLIGAVALGLVVLVGVVVAIVVHSTSKTDSTTDTTVRATTSADFGSTPCPVGTDARRQVHFTSKPRKCIDFSGHYTATFTTTAGTFTVTLDAAQAPVTVNNFLVLAEYHYYDGSTFHRVIPDYVVQGGDPTGKPPGTGSPGYTIADEFPSSLSDYVAGSVAMANTGAPNSGGSQFFIWVGPQALPSPTYSLFGQVSSGMDVVRKIAAGGSPSGVPAHPVTITSISIGQASLVSG